MDIRYRIQGGIPLYGKVAVNGSKNAVLPLIAGSVLCKGTVIFHNVPNLSDVHDLLAILEFLGAKTTFIDSTVTIDNSALQSKPIPHSYVSKLRGSIVLLGPLLARFGVAEMSYPGGCVLGKRPIEAHVLALTQLGAQDMSADDTLHFQGTLKAGTVILPEFSVTATENALFAAASIDGTTTIEMAAAEPHVQDVCHFIQAMGATVEGIGSHTLVVHGTNNLLCPEHTVTSDYLEAGMFAIAALVTKGKLDICNTEYSHLISFLDTLRRAGAVWQYNAEHKILTVDGESSDLKAVKLQTNIFPGFPTDLQAPMGVLLTQSAGVSRIFEVLFEGRMSYLYELETMGAHIEILNAHQALIIGPTQLRGRTVASNDIRAGAAMVLAALCAKGESTVTNIQYLERGYSQLDERLRSIGANVERYVIE